MQRYWRRLSIPELTGLPRRERSRVWGMALRRSLLHWQVWLALLAYGVIKGSASYFIANWANITWGHHTFKAWLAFGLVGAPLAILLLLPLWQTGCYYARKHVAEIRNRLAGA
ncbi:MAG: hypothetical protein WD042_00875 [Phycisphaeraceae bacterium]